MAQALLEQIRILRSVPELRSGLLKPPAWAAYDQGPWPIPHDPIFDFTTTPVGYEANRHAPFSKSDQVAATAAATWVLAYNARCGLSAETFGYPAREGSALKTLSRYGASYLTLQW